jgi:hypothetical protein
MKRPEKPRASTPVSLREQYAELLKPREEIKKITSSRINHQRQA